MGTRRRSKVFNDPIHGHIELPPLCVEIVDTPQFQRLRNIKQLGTCYLVYPGASHNRFEHSLGVCHLAGQILRAIDERQPNLITEKDKLCVQIAALCHDLGHGPFSCLFEKKFIPSMHQDREWKHEEASLKMFDYMLNNNNGSLRESIQNNMEGFEEKDITFIKEMMNPKVVRQGDEWPYLGRPRDKGFLYQIVLNNLTGIDVDGWDCLTRDCYMLGMKNIFDHNRCISVARVIKADDDSTHICFRDKEAQDIYDMFYTRMTLYRRAYQHKTNNIIGRMVCDALQTANEHLTFRGKNREEISLANTITDMEAFSKVTDEVLYTIYHSTDVHLETAREIVDNIMRRKLYKCVGQTQKKSRMVRATVHEVLEDEDNSADGHDGVHEEIPVNANGVLNEAEFKEALLENIKQKQGGEAVRADHVLIDVVQLNYGLEDKDPIKHVKFYSKFEENTILTLSKEQVSYVLPDTFTEEIVRVYSKSESSEREIKIVKDSFSEWCEEKGYPKPKDKL